MIVRRHVCWFLTFSMKICKSACRPEYVSQALWCRDRERKRIGIVGRRKGTNCINFSKSPCDLMDASRGKEPNETVWCGRRMNSRFVRRYHDVKWNNGEWCSLLKWTEMYLYKCFCVLCSLICNYLLIIISVIDILWVHCGCIL